MWITDIKAYFRESILNNYVFNIIFLVGHSEIYAFRALWCQNGDKKLPLTYLFENILIIRILIHRLSNNSDGRRITFGATIHFVKSSYLRDEGVYFSLSAQTYSGKSGCLISQLLKPFH